MVKENGPGNLTKSYVHISLSRQTAIYADHHHPPSLITSDRDRLMITNYHWPRLPQTLQSSDHHRPAQTPHPHRQPQPPYSSDHHSYLRSHRPDRSPQTHRSPQTPQTTTDHHRPHRPHITLRPQRPPQISQTTTDSTDHHTDIVDKKTERPLHSIINHARSIQTSAYHREPWA